MFNGHISPGRIESRPIQELGAKDVPYRRAHWFSGIAGWELALKLARWPSNIHTWTGSCPCQPFSVAGKQKGIHDDRHLWPVWFNLIRVCKPSVVFGEQVSSKSAYSWLERVFIDLESASYAVAGADLPAASVGAPHQRQRLYWVAYATGKGLPRPVQVERIHRSEGSAFTRSGHDFTVARRALAGDFNDLLPVDGISKDMGRGRLKAYGNSIVPQVAAAFISSVMQALNIEPEPEL